MIKQETIHICDACGKQETDVDIQRRKDSSRSFTHSDIEVWRKIRAGYRPDAMYRKNEYDVCSWACAKAIHAKLAEVEFDRKSAENEAACLKWAFEQAGITANAAREATDKLTKALREIESLSSELRLAKHTNQQIDSLIATNSRLEEELAQARKFGREELAQLLRDVLRHKTKD